MTLDKTGQAGTEIEITPEMIKAGRAVLAEVDEEEDLPSEVVAAIFRAMVGASQKGK